MEPRQEDKARLESFAAMSASVDANSGTMAIRADFRFDKNALERWMTQNIRDFAGPIKVEQFKGGQSNPTYKLVTKSKSYVLRRKPPGQLVKGAHAIEREARVLSALGAIGFPVAQVYGLCEDERILGTPFFVMEMVEGRIFWDATFPDIRRDDRPAYFDAMNLTIAQLHSVDPGTIGLNDYGKPGNYFARQISRWSKQYLDDTDAGADSRMDFLIQWLAENIPADDTCALVHGDFRCDNLIFHPVEPQVIAVLDWELSTLGHPLADFAYHATMYRMPPDIVAGLAGNDLKRLNIPSEADYVASYCGRTGRTSIPDYEFYIAFNLFRLAAIFHGIKGRVIRGTAASPHARERAANFSRLAQFAFESIEACR